MQRLHSCLHSLSRALAFTKPLPINMQMWQHCLGTHHLDEHMS